MFGKLFGHPIPYHKSLDTPLLNLGRRDKFTIRDACEGVQIFGGVGSGKSSGSGQALAKSYLKAGMGGLVCCAKPDEADLWRRYAKECRRENDIVFFDQSGSLKFNFLDYAQATIASDGFDNNLVDLMARLAEAARVADTQGGGGGDNQFFRDAAMQLLANAFPILRVAYGSIRLKQLYQFITSAPQTREQTRDKDWQLNSFCSQTLLRAAHEADSGNLTAERVLEEHGDYWINEFSGLGDRTRGSVVTTLTSTIYPFMSGKMHELLCTETNIVPELCREGLIIVLDLPTRRFGRAGAVAQQIFKLLWQLSMESRSTNDKTRPVFMWADEAQFFMNSYDTEHLSVARSQRCCSVFITQDISTYYSQIGSSSGKEAADSLVSKFQTRIFHANTDRITNEYASEVVGRVTKYNETHSMSEGSNVGSGGTIGEEQGGYSGGTGRNRSTNRGFSTREDYAIPPHEFAQSLRTGGPDNKFRVDGIVIRNGKNFKSSSSHFVKAEFNQK